MSGSGGTETNDDNLSLIAVGDIMMGEDSLCIGHGVGSKIEKMGVNYPFLQVAPTLKEGDIVFGNLEAVLSRKGVDSSRLHSLQMRAKPEAVRGLQYAGFNVLSVANNHALEHGQEALLETVNILSENNIEYVGVDADITKARAPRLMHVKGITIAFLAYCLVPDKTAYLSIKEPEEICADAKRAKSGADIVIVSLHWGNEYIARPSPAQIRLAHQIVDSGANLILGHHPHVVQGMEKYHNGVIAYSLGNFVFDMWQEKMRKSMILRCRLSKQGVCSVEVIPAYINNNYQPEIIKGKQAGSLLSEIESQSSKISIESSSDFDNSMKGYLAEVATHRRQYRRGLKWYFLRHLYRYPPRFTLQILRGYLSKMLSRAS